MRLVAAGVEVDVLYAEAGRHASIEEDHLGVRLRAVPAWPKDRDWQLAPGLWREMGHQPWDLVHVQSYHTLVAPLAMIRALGLGLPYCLTFHAGGHTSAWRSRVRPLQLRALRPLLARAARLIVLARFEIPLYSRWLRLPEPRFALIPNGVDVTPQPVPLALDPERDVVASIGRLERYKGHHRVIRAFPFVLAERPAARLMIIGEGSYEPELRRLTHELALDDRVQFTHFPPDDPAGLARILRETSLVVLMSQFETQPLSALEAAAARRRLLVSDRGGLRELSEDGLARAVPLDTSPPELGRYILEELEQPAPARAPELPTWDDCAGQLLGLYRSIVS